MEAAPGIHPGAAGPLLEGGSKMRGAEFSRGIQLQPGKDLGEMVLVGEPGTHGNLLDGKIAEMQQVTCPLNPLPADKRLGTFLHRFRKKTNERIAGQAAVFRQPGIVQLLVKPCGDEIDALQNPPFGGQFPDGRPVLALEQGMPENDVANHLATETVGQIAVGLDEFLDIGLGEGIPGNGIDAIPHRLDSVDKIEMDEKLVKRNCGGGGEFVTGGNQDKGVRFQEKGSRRGSEDATRLQVPIQPPERGMDGILTPRPDVLHPPAKLNLEGTTQGFFAGHNSSACRISPLRFQPLPSPPREGAPDLVREATFPFAPMPWKASYAMACQHSFPAPFPKGTKRTDGRKKGNMAFRQNSLEN